jgi:hypothetical protein
MYYYWKEKGILPSVLYNLPSGELMVIRAFYEREIEEKHKNPPICPFMKGV